MLKAYIINLSSAKERKERMQEEIARLGEQKVIEFCFYEAIAVGSEKFGEYQAHYKRDFLTQLYRGKKLSDGEKACFASHYSLWQKCMSENRAMLILEDDIVFLKNFIDGILYLKNKEYDFVRLMNFFKKKYIRVDSYIAKTFEGICGGQGYYLVPKAAEHFVKKAKIWICPVDDFLDKVHLHGIDNLFFSPSLICQDDGGVSCIGDNGRNQKPKIGFIITREIASSFEFIWRKFYGYIYQ